MEMAFCDRGNIVVAEFAGLDPSDFVNQALPMWGL